MACQPFDRVRRLQQRRLAFSQFTNQIFDKRTQGAELSLEHIECGRAKWRVVHLYVVCGVMIEWFWGSVCGRDAFNSRESKLAICSATNFYYPAN